MGNLNSVLKNDKLNQIMENIGIAYYTFDWIEMIKQVIDLVNLAILICAGRLYWRFAGSLVNNIQGKNLTK